MGESAQMWRQIAEVLYSALHEHRSDMHRRSSRPCTTCRQSASAIREYDDAVNRDYRQPAARRGEDER